MKYGVSPAFFYCLYGEKFSCDQMSESLPMLVNMGFTCWQPEIYLPSRLEEWETDAQSRLRAQSQRLGLSASQFVAHFLLHGFESSAQLSSDKGIDECRRLIGAISEWTDLKVVTIPLPTFQITHRYSPACYCRDFDRLVDKLGLMNRMIVDSGRKCGLEILPGSLLGGSEGVLRLKEREVLKNVYVNLDTGHFNAASEPLSLTLGRIGGSISGTHLCDNNGIINVSNEPGTGTVDWKVFADYIKQGKYSGSLDIEIHCETDEVENKYKAGLRFIEGLLA